MLAEKMMHLNLYILLTLLQFENRIWYINVILSIGFAKCHSDCGAIFNGGIETTQILKYEQNYKNRSNGNKNLEMHF